MSSITPEDRAAAMALLGQGPFAQPAPLQEILEQLREVVHRVPLDVGGGLAKPFPFGDQCRALVAFRPHEPQRLVVPLRARPVRDEFRGLVRMGFRGCDHQAIIGNVAFNGTPTAAGGNTGS